MPPAAPARVERRDVDTHEDRNFALHAYLLHGRLDHVALFRAQDNKLIGMRGQPNVEFGSAFSHRGEGGAHVSVLVDLFDAVGYPRMCDESQDLAVDPERSYGDVAAVLHGCCESGGISHRMYFRWNAPRGCVER